MDVNWLQPAGDGVLLAVKVTPRAAADAVAGIEGGRLRVRLRAPPADGKANTALTRWLAARLGVPRSAVTIVAGESARLKRVSIRGVNAARARTLLAPGGGRPGETPR